MSRNLLDQETSPYLLLHKDNPVHWRPWGPAAFEEAETTGKPILLSIGYTACHWCHVMNEESFGDPDVATLMNENFINIKVDREERPDVDQIYQTAATALGHQGGWPLTMFLTPRGEPFVAGAYFPKEDRAGAPAFKRILPEVTRLYNEQPEPVAQTAARVQTAFAQLWGRDLRGRSTAPSSTSARSNARSVTTSSTAASRRRRNSRPRVSPKCCGGVTCAPARCNSRSSSRPRSTTSASAASTITSAAASIVIASTSAGSFRISRRCSTITHCCSIF